MEKQSVIIIDKNMNNYSSSNFDQDKDFKQSLEQYEEMKAGNTTGYFDSDQLADFAEHYASSQKYDEAFEVIDYALSIHPSSTEVLVIKAHIFIEQKKIEEAKKIANSIAENYSRDVKLLKAELLILDQKVDEADTLLVEIANEDENNCDNILDAAYLFLDYDLPNKALPLFERALSLSPENNEIRLNLVDCYIQCEQTEKAIALCNKLIDKDPYSTQYWYELGRLYYSINEFNKSLEAYEFALTIDDNHKSSILMTAHCYYKLENYLKACEYYKKYDDITPESKMNVFFIGLCYFNLKEYENSIEWLKQALTLSDNLAIEAVEIYDYISTSYDKMGDLENALHYIDLAINNEPELADSYVSKGKIYLSNAREEDAILWFNKAIELDKENPETYLEIGSVYFDSKRYEQALKYFLIVNETSPGFDNSYILTAYTYAALKNVEEFNNFFTKASKQNPNNIIDSLGFITAEEEELKRIINEITDAIEEDEDEDTPDTEDFNLN